MAWMGQVLLQHPKVGFVEHPRAVGGDRGVKQGGVWDRTSEKPQEWRKTVKNSRSSSCGQAGGGKNPGIVALRLSQVSWDFSQ